MDITDIPFINGLDIKFLFPAKKIFIIHGHDTINILRLKNLLYDFNLKPIVISEENTFEITAILEKFEKFGSKCRYAIALCTPDDRIQVDEKYYHQPRPNVIYEIGWFCAKKGRKKVMLLVKDGTKIFSDFDGVLHAKFKDDVEECHKHLYKALKSQKLI